VAAMFVNGLGRIHAILFSDWLISKKSSPLKLFRQMNGNLVRSIYGMSSMKIVHFILMKQELPVAAMFVYGSGQNEHSLERTFHRCFLPSFGSFGKAVSQEKIFLRSSMGIAHSILIR
jgi:hypothetical protein